MNRIIEIVGKNDFIFLEIDSKAAAIIFQRAGLTVEEAKTLCKELLSDENKKAHYQYLREQEEKQRMQKRETQKAKRERGIKKVKTFFGKFTKKSEKTIDDDDELML